MPDTLLGQRDRTTLLLSSPGAFRRSELVALEAEVCAESPEGFTPAIPLGNASSCFCRRMSNIEQTASAPFSNLIGIVAEGRFCFLGTRRRASHG